MKLIVQYSLLKNENKQEKMRNIKSKKTKEDDLFETLCAQYGKRTDDKLFWVFIQEGQQSNETIYRRREI